MTGHDMHHYSDADLKYARNDSEGRRCDGNSRRCTERAVEQHLVRRIDPNSHTIGAPELRQTCSRHRQQFINSAAWEHVSTSRMGGMAWPNAS